MTITSSTESLGNFFLWLAEKSQDVFWIRDNDYHTVLYLSPAFEKIWGLSLEQFYQDESIWASLIHKEDFDRYCTMIETIREHAHEDKSITIDYRIINARKELKNIHEICFPIYGIKNQLLGFAGITKDVTAEKNAS